MTGSLSSPAQSFSKSLICCVPSLSYRRLVLSTLSPLNSSCHVSISITCIGGVITGLLKIRVKLPVLDNSNTPIVNGDSSSYPEPFSFKYCCLKRRYGCRNLSIVRVTYSATIDAIPSWLIVSLTDVYTSLSVKMLCSTTVRVYWPASWMSSV